MKTKNANGISLKTQELYLIVFLTRYLDLFTNKTSLYNTLFKIFYIAASAGLVYLIRFREPFKSMYLFERDTFLHWKFAVLPCAVLALFINDINWTGFNAWLIFREYCWSFSIFLEAIAIFPQLVLLTRDKDVENITSHYIATLGAYRALYILNWIYRAWTEPHYSAWLPWFCGAVQTLLYADFFWRYFKSVKAGTTLKI
ncbi:ERD2B [Symbiodinium sp. KB8]|nr:ERD2B [Symbiodinium sp. KB8]